MTAPPFPAAATTGERVATSPPVTPQVRPVRRIVWAPIELGPLPEPPPHALARKRILVIGGDEAERRTLGERLAAAGAVVHETPQDGLDGIVDLNVGSYTGPPDWHHTWQTSWETLGSVVEDWASETDCTRLFYCVVTRTGGELGVGSRPVVNPLGGLWAGLAKGVPREIPNCAVRVLDLEPQASPDELADIVVKELSVSGESAQGLFEVGIQSDEKGPARRVTVEGTDDSLDLEAGTRLSLGPKDVVVMSGGGRGIGFEFALQLATGSSCGVVVTGTAAPPDLTDPRITMSEEDFRRLRGTLLREAAAARRVAAVRREIAELDRSRVLAQNLARAAAAGADIRYQACDVTDAAAVRDLLRNVREGCAEGQRLSGIIHNAGSNQPHRLGRGNAAATLRTLNPKVVGFENLVDAAMMGGMVHEVRFVCNVGSLTGRWGGMVGQLDYGAANEALRQLGRAARSSAARRQGPAGPAIFTIEWPTWENVGMVTNYSAAVSHMSAMSIEEGVRHWERELTCGQGRDVSFVGEMGPVANPVLLRGYAIPPAVPGILRLRALREVLGVPRRYRPRELLVSEVDLMPSDAGSWGEFWVGGAPAVPVSVVVNRLLGAAAWLAGPDERCSGLRDVAIRPAGLVRDAGGGRPMRQEVQVLPARPELPGVQREVACHLVDPAGRWVARGVVTLTSHPALPPASGGGDSPLETGGLPQELTWAHRLLRRGTTADPRDILSPGSYQQFWVDAAACEVDVSTAYAAAGGGPVSLVRIQMVRPGAGRPCVGISFDGSGR